MALDEELRKIVLSCRWLFRGTTVPNFASRMAGRNIYFGNPDPSRGKHAVATSTTPVLVYAMTYAMQRVGDTRPHVHPLLLAIDSRPYIDAIEPGIEGHRLPIEFVITKPIQLEHMEIICDREQIATYAPSAAPEDLQRLQNAFDVMVRKSSTAAYNQRQLEQAFRIGQIEGNSPWRGF